MSGIHVSLPARRGAPAMTDLIVRLRSPGPCSSPHHGSLHREAAEELERLRAEAAEAKLRDAYCARCHERMYP